MKEPLASLASEERGEVVLETGLSYTPDHAVAVRVRKRERRYDVDDGGAAVRLSGKPTGWLHIAERLVEAKGMNVNRRGVVFVPAVEGRDIHALVLRVAKTSLALYLALLESELEAGSESGR